MFFWAERDPPSLLMSSPFPVPNVVEEKHPFLAGLRDAINVSPSRIIDSLSSCSLVLAEKEVIDCSMSSMEYTIPLTELMLAFCP
jgi:hypothetical protein